MTTQTDTINTGEPAENSVDNESFRQLDALMASALKIHRSQLQMKFSVMLDCADESLIGLIESADVNDSDAVDLDSETDQKQKNDDYEKLVRTLQSERDNIENSFLKAVNGQGTQDRPKTDEPATNSALSLIDQDEMDEMVAVTAAYTNAMNIFGEEVNNLATRFDYLEMSTGRSLPKHIFDLRHICEAFQTSLDSTELSTTHKLLLLKLFDRDVSSRLDEMYKSINKLFIDAGVLPEVVYSVKNQESASYPAGEEAHEQPDVAGEMSSQAGGPHHDQGEDAARDEAPEKGQSPLNAVGRFISQFMGGFSTAKGEGIPKSFSSPPSDADENASFSRNDLMEALSKLQSDLSDIDIDSAAEIDAEHIKRELIARMGRGQGGAITKTVRNHDQRYIDFVGMIFHAITEDESISMVITNLLMMLQIPIIKTAMLDEDLFTETDHPARVTLDLITIAGRGVTEAQDDVFIELKQIVDDVIKHYETDRSSFEKAVVELESLIKTQQEVAAENEKNEQHEIIKQHARSVVLGEMRLITKNKVIPADNRPLMLKLWPSLMFNYYINYGIESSEWLLSLKTFNNLMDFLQPIENRMQWQRLNDNHESLLETVGEELRKTRRNKSEIDEQLSALQRTFTDSLDASRSEYGDHAEPVEPDRDASTTLDDAAMDNIMHDDQHGRDHDDKAARIEEQVRLAKEKISRLPSDLHPGVWFEIFDGDDRPVRRLKLSVILADVAKLVFVDRQGIVVLEKDADEFLHELENAQSRFIADHSTFENALGSVIHTFSA